MADVISLSKLGFDRFVRLDPEFRLLNDESATVNAREHFTILEESFELLSFVRSQLTAKNISTIEYPAYRLKRIFSRLGCPRLCKMIELFIERLTLFHSCFLMGLVSMIAEEMSEMRREFFGSWQICDQGIIPAWV